VQSVVNGNTDFLIFNQQASKSIPSVSNLLIISLSQYFPLTYIWAHDPQMHKVDYAYYAIKLILIKKYSKNGSKTSRGT